MQTYQFVAILLHILAAALWIGGMAFLGVVLIPILRGTEVDQQAADLLHRTGVRFRAVGWACLVMLVVTGAVNLTRWGIDWERFTSGELWRSPWGGILAAKLVLVAGVLILSAVHDFSIGPRATTRLRESPESAEARRLRRLAGWMGRTNLLMGLAIVALAILLVRGLPV